MSSIIETKVLVSIIEDIINETGKCSGKVFSSR